MLEGLRPSKTPYKYIWRLRLSLTLLQFYPLIGRNAFLVTNELNGKDYLNSYSITKHCGSHLKLVNHLSLCCRKAKVLLASQHMV